MAKPKRLEDDHPRLRRSNRKRFSWRTALPALVALVIFLRLLVAVVASFWTSSGNDNSSDGRIGSDLDIFTPIYSEDLSPVIFVCCQRIYGEEGNQGQLSRSLPKDHKQKNEIPVDVRYMNAPCFSQEEWHAGNPKSRGASWPVHKSFPSEYLEIFRQRIAEVHRQGGMVLAEGNCNIPQAELANVWLESMIDSQTGRNGTVSQRIIDKFLLQDKKDLRRVIVKHGFDQYVPKHYSADANQTKDGDFPVVLKREKSEGGVGVYIINSIEEMNQRMAEDSRFEAMGMRHKKSRHRTIGTGWVVEEFLPGATQELVVYLRPRGTSDGSAYFWCGSHSNQRWHDDGNFVKGYDDLRGTVTTPKDCSRHPEILELMSTVMRNEGIYGTGCINYKYGKDGKPKVHDWNLRTCNTMSSWNKGAVFLDLVNQIPRRQGSKKLALFTKQ